jgi:hypothetical protein
MKGYLDRLTLSEVSDFKIFLIDFIENTNILKDFNITKGINHKVFSIFFDSALQKFKT